MMHTAQTVAADHLDWDFPPSKELGVDALTQTAQGGVSYPGPRLLGARGCPLAA